MHEVRLRKVYPANCASRKVDVPVHKVPTVKEKTVVLLIRRWMLLILAIEMLASPPALGQAFFSVIDDLPLSPGLTEAVEKGVLFDNPGGRIVTAIAYGNDGVSVYRLFYEKALPALGWRAQSGGTYRRDGEALRIDFKSRDQGVEIRIRVVPAGSKKVP